MPRLLLLLELLLPLLEEDDERLLFTEPEELLERLDDELRFTLPRLLELPDRLLTVEEERDRVADELPDRLTVPRLRVTCPDRASVRACVRLAVLRLALASTRDRRAFLSRDTSPFPRGR